MLSSYFQVSSQLQFISLLTYSFIISLCCIPDNHIRSHTYIFSHDHLRIHRMTSSGCSLQFYPHQIHICNAFEVWNDQPDLQTGTCGVLSNGKACCCRYYEPLIGLTGKCVMKFQQKKKVIKKVEQGVCAPLYIC